ncbi:hypothetical protein LGK95_03605 [Clostridium algoriphilum]|uniref:hypothetical protein n=1 Tax=Clostridium algoriphilum TaxID=198347 RepID=UPI001CF3B154|nr:hypothetical protein [Clostridium algoriphilum]MCB2292623.1 hypothetical protein [Clostridium algoriphilum]
MNTLIIKNINKLDVKKMVIMTVLVSLATLGVAFTGTFLIGAALGVYLIICHR